MFATVLAELCWQVSFNKTSLLVNNLYEMNVCIMYDDITPI